MADRVYDDNPAVVAPAFTRKADGAIPFGKLVTKGTAAGDVKVATGATDSIMGVAAPNEVVYGKSGNAEYADGDVVTVKALLPGKVYCLYAEGSISEGDKLQAGAAGDVKTATGHTHTYSASPTDPTVANQTIGIALEDIADDNWGKVLVV